MVFNENKKITNGRGTKLRQYFIVKSIFYYLTLLTYMPKKCLDILKIVTTISIIVSHIKITLFLGIT